MATYNTGLFKAFKQYFNLKSETMDLNEDVQPVISVGFEKEVIDISASNYTFTRPFYITEVNMGTQSLLADTGSKYNMAITKPGYGVYNYYVLTTTLTAERTDHIFPVEMYVYPGTTLTTALTGTYNQKKCIVKGYYID